MSGYRDGDEPVPGYRLVTFLGRGSYGEVWKATGPGGTEAALKFIALDSRQGLKEFRAVGLVKRLRHPNLCPIQAIWLRDPAGNVMTDAPSGDPDESLTTRIKLGGPKELVIAMGLGDLNLAQQAENARTSGGIPPRLLLRYMDGAARGIDYLNEPSHPPANSPIIHCDIKPANLLVVGGDVQVCDYGVARAIGSDAKKTLGAGTPAYAAPELIGNDPCPQTDQYSLAVTYFELRTGRLPFDEARALVANMTGALDLSALAPDERAVIARATSLRPELRYPTVQDMVEELKVACGVTLTRSAAIPQPAARRLPTPAPAPAPRPPEVASPPPWASTEVWRTPVGPSETVPFPEVVRETPPPPRAEPATTTPWATDPALEPVDSPMRRRWVAPLAAGLVAVAVAVAGFVATRPDPSPPSTPPSTDPPQKHGSASQGNDKQSDPGAGQTGSKTTGKGRVQGSEKPSHKVDSPPPPLATRLADHDLKTAADIDAAATIANELMPKTAQAERDKVRDLVTQGLEDTAKTQQWRKNLTATGAYTAQELKEPREWSEAADRLARLIDIPKDAPIRKEIQNGRVLVGLANAVLTKAPDQADTVGRYEAARLLGKGEGVPPTLRYEFVYQPAATQGSRDGLAGLKRDRHPQTARLLVRMAIDLRDDAWPGGVPEPMTRRTAADRLLVRAVGFSPVDAADEAGRREPSLKSGEFAVALGDAADRTTDLAAARPLYEQAVRAGGKHPRAAKWYSEMGGSIIAQLNLKEMKFENREQAREIAVMCGYFQMSYLLVAEKDPPQTGAKDIVKKCSVLKKNRTYGNVAEALGKYENGAPVSVKAAIAEFKYMQSDMTEADRNQLAAALVRIPDDATLEARDCRDRMERLHRAPTLGDLRQEYGID